MARFIFICLVITSKVVAQPSPENCSCNQLFNESVSKISSMYAGFPDKVNAQTRSGYDRMVIKLNNLSLSSITDRSCYSIIKQYIAWFRDGHVGISYSVQSSPASQRRIDNKKIVHSKVNQTGIEGIWATADKREQYVIMKDPSKLATYIAVVIASTDTGWQAGMVKVEFESYDPGIGRYLCMYYRHNFYGIQESFQLNGNRLEHYMGPAWYRDGIVSKEEKAASTDPMRVEFRMINDDLVYLKLGSFMQWKVRILDSIITANRSRLLQAKNLIIDLRGNSGGDGSTSNELLQLIYTNPIVYPSSQIRSSPELIGIMNHDLEKMEENDPRSRYLISQKKLLEQLKSNPGKLIRTGDSVVRRLDSVYSYPERVAILTDKGSASASEYFVFESKQSKKVTRFGSNTAGAMDYGNVREVKLSCNRFTIRAATSRNGWIDRFGFRIDNTGFQPDVRIPAGEDWIQFVSKYWSK
jgi:hypothetical protein